MDTIENIRTFLAVVKAGNFSAAARSIDTVPSVVAKRINQLENQLGVQLFVRSTRRLELTDIGQRHYPRFAAIVTELDNAFKDVAGSASRLDERLRIKCPTTLTIMHIGNVLIDFRETHPGVRMDIVLMDRSVNPAEEGFDIAIGALPSSYPNVTDIPLCPMPRILVASPDYLARAGTPKHPRDLIEHDCLIFLATGSNWSFQGPAGSITVDVPTSFGVNESHVLLGAAEKGLGITMIASHIARPSLKAGNVVQLLADYPVPDLWVKALIPESRRRNPAVREVLRWLKDATHPIAPWDRV